jgi:hypothetical protein
MQETPNEFKSNQPSESSEQEVSRQRISELIEQRNFLTTELKGLIEEERAIIAGRASDDASFERLIAINQRERELVEKQGEIETDVSELWNHSH